MKEKFSLKDALFNPEKVRQLASEIKSVHKSFEDTFFEADVLAPFPELELKERITHIGAMLHKYLPNSFYEATEIIKNALPEELDSNKYDNDFGDFIYAPYASYIAAYGCNEVHLERSLEMLRILTRRFSVEFAIRDFINTFPDETLKMLSFCTDSSHYHERRLASEGLRPNLPWAKKLTLDYRVPIVLLDRLYADKTRYVTRSVANHLNDISKFDPQLVLETLERWQALQEQEAKEMSYIVKHALRTLVKSGNAQALEMLGYVSDPPIRLSELTLHQQEIQIGEAVSFSFFLEAESSCRLLLDYVVYFQTKNGKLTPKVHKIKTVHLNKGELLKIEKKHLFKANMSTRKLYEGEHRMEVQINGTRYDLGTFRLTQA